MRKWGLAIATIVAILFAGAYFGSPYLAARNFKQAALAADSDRLDTSVDFPAVRESLKSQFSALMLNKMQNDPDMKNNPFAGLGMMIGPVIIDKAVDAYVTPDGISALVRGQKPKNGAPVGMSPDINASYEWLGIDRFRVKLTNTKTNTEGPALLFERRGLFSWKLIKVYLPANLVDKNNEVSVVSAPQTADGDVAPVASAVPPATTNSSSESDTEQTPLAKLPAPDFASWPAATYNGPHAPVDFANSPPSVREFRTVTREGMAQGPNFAGRYTVIDFGCGADCTSYEIGDQETGRVYEFPLSDDGNDMDTQQQIGSRLLRATWQVGPICHATDMVWEGNHFRIVGQLTAQGACDERSAYTAH